MSAVFHMTYKHHKMYESTVTTTYLIFKTKMEGSWQELPEEMVVNVFKYLEKGDRFRASLVSKTWYRCFFSPQIWRNVDVEFTSENDENLIRLVMLFGSSIQSLCIKCHQQSVKNRESTCKFIEALAARENLRLSEFTMVFCGQNPLFFSGSLLVDSLKGLFTSKPTKKLSNTVNCLKVINLSEVLITFDDTLLNIIADNYGENLECLNIQNNTLTCGISQECMIDFIIKAKHLKHLFIHSCSFSSAAAEELVKENRRPIEFLSLLYTRMDKFTKNITCAAWEKVNDHLPALRVELYFDHTYPLDMTFKIMLPQVPVSKLKLCLLATVTEQILLGASYYKETLEELEISSTPSTDLDHALLYAAKECSKLREIHVWCPVGKETVEQILDICSNLERHTLVYKGKAL